MPESRAGGANAAEAKRGQVVMGLVYHQLRASGRLAQNARSLHRIGMSDSAFGQRRQGLPQDLFEEITAAALRPLADPERHPGAFLSRPALGGRGRHPMQREQHARAGGRVAEGASRRQEAAFAKLQVVTLIELGLHNPLAAVVVPASSGEVTLAKRIWRRESFAWTESERTPSLAATLLSTLLRGGSTTRRPACATRPLLSSRHPSTRQFLARKNRPALLRWPCLPVYRKLA